jgi:hypothetical protein
MDSYDLRSRRLAQLRDAPAKTRMSSGNTRTTVVVDVPSVLAGEVRVFNATRWPEPPQARVPDAAVRP